MCFVLFSHSFLLGKTVTLTIVEFSFLNCAKIVAKAIRAN